MKLVPAFEPALARRLFLSGLGLVYAIAFASLAVQVVGLVGERGILPVGEFLDHWRRVGERTGELAQVRRVIPTLCWLESGDASLRIQCGAGFVLGLLLFAGVAPLLVLPPLWALYLSLTVAGQEFLQFQWDTLLLETGFFAIWLAPGGLLPWGPPRWLLLRRRAPDDPEPAPPTAVSAWALRLLLFRFIFASGWVKLSHSDPTWRDLTALTFHYWTQPLPNPVAWYVHQAPLWLHKLCCAGMFGVELLAPWLLFAGRIGRSLFGLATIGLAAVIAATGNYGFFEPLTAVLALFLLERRPGARPTPVDGPTPSPRGSWPLAIGRTLAASIAAAATLLALLQFGGQLASPRLRVAEESRLARPLEAALDAVEAACTTEDELTGRRVVRLHGLLGWIAPFRTLNTYGLFRVMTTERNEIVIEGSDDGETWTPYEFRFKPGDPARPPCLCAPHMPRLDWQMWFAAFGRPPRWFERLLDRLLEGEPSVLALFGGDPFARSPPRFVRAVLHEYRFATPETRRATGDWWFRADHSLYSRPVSRR